MLHELQRPALERAVGVGPRVPRGHLGRLPVLAEGDEEASDEAEAPEPDIGSPRIDVSGLLAEANRLEAEDDADEVFDDDIDVTNLEEVFWALTTRLHPGTGIHVAHNAPAHPLYPYISDQERRERRTDRVALDCTWPTHWPADDIPLVA